MVEIGSDPDKCLAVRVPGPEDGGQIEAKEGTEQRQNHVVVCYGLEQAGCLGQVQGIGHDKEGVPKQGEVVTQTLCEHWGALQSHLEEGELLLEPQITP